MHPESAECLDNHFILHSGVYVISIGGMIRPSPPRIIVPMRSTLIKVACHCLLHFHLINFGSNSGICRPIDQERLKPGTGSNWKESV